MNTPAAPPASHEKILEWLLDECQQTGVKIGSLVALDERLVTIGTTLIVGAATIGVVNGKEEILLGIPLAMSALLAFIAYLHGEMFALGGYKAALEETITDRLGQPIVLWESRVSVPVRHRSRATFTALTFLALVYGAGCCAAIVEARRTRHVHGWYADHSSLVLSLTIASIVVGGISSTLALLSARSEHAKAKAITAAALTGS